MIEYEDFCNNYKTINKFPIINALLNKFDNQSYFNPQDMSGVTRQTYEGLLRIDPTTELLLNYVNESVKVSPTQKHVLNAAKVIVSNRDTIAKLNDYCYGETKPENVKSISSYIAFSILYLIGSESVTVLKDDGTPPARYSVVYDDYRDKVDKLRQYYLKESVRYFSEVIDILTEVKLDKWAQHMGGLQPSMMLFKPRTSYVEIFHELVEAVSFIDLDTDYFNRVNIFRIYEGLKPINFEELKMVKLSKEEKKDGK